MTVCLYISPPQQLPTGQTMLLPVILADTLATFYPRLSGGQPLIPANPDIPLGGESPVRLVRKISLFGASAFALAGNSNVISPALTEIKYFAESWNTEDRPMRKLAEMADRFRFEAIGCAVIDRDDGSHALHHVAPKALTIKTRHLGLCAAAGSGAKALLDQCQEADVAFDSWDPTRATALDKVVGFVNSVNAHRLAAELLGSEGARESWGGYIEWAFYDYGQKKWRYGPRTLHLFPDLETTDGALTLLPARCAIAFDPDETEPRALGMVDRVREFRFDNVKNPGQTSESSMRDFWSDWQPEIVCVTAIGIDQHGVPLIIPRTLTNDQLGHVKFILRPEGVQTGISAELLNEIGADIAQSFSTAYKATVVTDNL